MFRNRTKQPADRRVRLRLTPLDDRTLPSTSYLTANLVSDQPGVAPVTDPTLVNGWGIALNPAGPFWISSNGRDLSEVYTGDVNGSPISQAFTVAIPGGSPTGQVFNGTADFKVSAGGVTAPARFIFASESGAVTGWNPGVPPSTPPPSKVAEVGFQASDGAIYKGIALAKSGGQNFLYLADFHNGKVDVLDANYHLTHLAGSFTDPDLQKGFAPFNVAAINGKLYVSYAKQDADAEDDVAGPANGFVDVFDTAGNFLQRLVTRGHLNSPWGMALAPASFGDLGGDLLVGNFGDGRINAYNPTTGDFIATMRSSPGHPVVIDGLWGLAFGNAGSINANTLYFAAGPDDETHGLFGKITANPGGQGHTLAAAGDFAATTSTGAGAVATDTTDPGQLSVARSVAQPADDTTPTGKTPAAGSPAIVGLGTTPGAVPVAPDWDDPVGGPMVE